MNAALKVNKLCCGCCRPITDTDNPAMLGLMIYHAHCSPTGRTGEPSPANSAAVAARITTADASRGLLWVAKVAAGVFVGLCVLAFAWPLLIVGAILVGIIKYSAAEFAKAARR